MNPQIQQKLKSLIVEHGTNLLNNPRRIKAMLKDLFPQNKREVRVLSAVLDEGLAQRLLRDSSSVPTSISIPQYAQILHDDLGIDLTLARWAVETWAIALSLEIPTPEPTPAPKPTPTPKPTQKLTRAQFALANLPTPAPTLPPKQAPTLKPTAVTTPKPTAPSSIVLIDNRYIDNQDGTVTDTQTGLQWKRCAEGQTWTGKGCSGEVKKYYWNDAIKLTRKFAGKTDWRLPTIDELKTLVLRGKAPTTHTQAFPNTPPSFFWSSSDSDNSSGAWGVYFGSGYDCNGYRYGSYHARLVRGGQPLPTTSPSLTTDAWMQRLWDWAYKNRVGLPQSKDKLTNLTELFLGSNQLTSLPPEIGKLTKLTELYLGNNELTSLPPEIGKLTNLTTLSLSDNQLTSLPPEIGKLTNLRDLYLNRNTLPKSEIDKIKRLLPNCKFSF